MAWWAVRRLQVFRLSILVEVTLTSAPLMHHHSAVAVARINTQVRAHAAPSASRSCRSFFTRSCCIPAV